MKVVLRVVGVVLFLTCLMTVSARGRAGGGSQVIKFKAADNQRDDHPWNLALTQLGDELKEASGGQMVIDLYTDGVLGGEAELMQSVKEGTVDLVVADPSLGSGFSRALDLFALPFLFRDYDHWQKVLDGPIGDEYSSLIEEQTGIKIIAYWGGSVRNVIAVGQPVRSVGDLEGFKLRLAASDLKFKVWSAVGASPTPVAFSETYSALQAGVVDGMENEYPSILKAKFYEAASYFTKTEHELTVRPLFMNAEAYRSLSDEQREIFLGAVRTATETARNLEKEAAEQARSTMVNNYGVQEYTIDKQPIRELTAPIFEEFAQEAGLVEIIGEIAAAP